MTFRVTGPLRLTIGCTYSTARSSDAGPTGRTTVTYFARTTVYGCAPHGEGTVILETSDGVRLASMQITVKPPRLKVPQEPINVGQPVTVVATNLYNVSSVIFGLSGPLHFNQSCTAERSRSANTLRSPRAGDRASVDIYGCAPGGTGIITLKNQDRTILNSASITVNPPSGNTPTGEISASLTTIDIGQETVLTVSNLNTYDVDAVLEFKGPIDADQFCRHSDGERPTPPPGTTSPVINNSDHTFYGCVPGGTATVKLKVGDFTLDTVTIEVNDPPEYAVLIPPPGPGYLCRIPRSFASTKVNDRSATIRSIGGYAHTATTEIWEALMTISASPFVAPRPSSKRCIEARIINESSPGTTHSYWTGDLYVTESALQTPVIDVDALIAGDFADFISLFAIQEPLMDGTLEREIDGSCHLCRGGTIQTNQLVRDGGTIKHYTVHVFSEHTFVLGGESETIELQVSQQISPVTHLLGGAYVTFVVAQLVSLGLDFALDKLIELATWIIMNI